MIRLCSRHVVPHIQIRRVPKGPRGTLTTAHLVAELIREGAKDFYVRQKAIEIFRSYRVPPKDRFGEVCAIFEWVRRHVRYTRDIFRVDPARRARGMNAT